jgi:RecA/RadA recombinase
MVKVKSLKEGDHPLQQVSGIGPKAVETLVEAGIDTVAKLAITRPEELKEILKITLKSAKDLVGIAKEIALDGALVPMTAKMVLELQNKQKRIPTGSIALDNVLKGGIPAEAITIISGEYGCHSDDTNVLTPTGIVSWKDLDIGDIVYGLDKNMNVIETNITDKFTYQYNGNLKHFVSKRYDFLVTPNHKMMVKSNNGFEYVEACNINENHKFVTSASWNGNDLPEYIDIHNFIPTEQRLLQYPNKSHPKENLNPIKLNDLIKLIGWYITEGSIFNTSRGIYVQIREMKYFDDVKTLLDNMGLDYSVYEDTKFVIFHQDLAKFLKYNCGEYTENKHIPNFIMNSSISNIKLLYETMMLGDGYYRGWCYYTSSETLKIQMINIALKMGYGVSVKENKMKCSILNGKIIRQTMPCYTIHMSYKSMGYIDKRYNIKDENYDGIVWCFTTETSNFITVRNGIVSISGNSGKTQMCYQFAVNCIKMGKAVAWIETESSTFIASRILEIAKHNNVDIDLEKDIPFVMKALQIETPYNMFLSYEILKKYVKEHNINLGLLVIDSFSAKFRSFFTGREQLPSRSVEEARHFGYLDRICSELNCAVVLTNQVMDTPDTGGQLHNIMKTGTRKEICGGNILKHSGTYLLQVAKTKSDEWTCYIQDTPDIPFTSVQFRILGSGIKDVVGKDGI